MAEAEVFEEEYDGPLVVRYTASGSASGLPASGSSNSSAAASPLIQQLTERNYQNAEPAAAPMLHSVDIHAGTVAEDDKWRTIGPREPIQFEWVANSPGL